MRAKVHVLRPGTAPLAVPPYTPPQNIEAEQAIIGSALVNNAVVERAAWLEPGDFFEPVHGRVWDWLKRQVEHGEIATPAALLHVFEHDPSLLDLDGVAYLTRMAHAADTITNAVGYARIVRNLARRRAAVAVGEALASRAADATGAPVEEVLGEAIGEVENLLTTGDAGKARDLQQVVDAIVARIETKVERWSVGLEALNQALGGGLPESYVVGVEARPKQFKTGSVGTIALNLAKQGVRVHYFALEMGPERITERMLGQVGGFNGAAIKYADDKALELTLRAREALPGTLTLEDCPGLRFDRLKALATEYAVRHGVKVFVLDYWQLVRPNGRIANRTEFLDEVAQWCADFAKKYRVSWLIAAQQNRDGHTRGSDGLIMACDWHAVLHKNETKLHHPRLGWVETLWFDVTYSRDGPGDAVGSRDEPLLCIHPHGPHLAELEFVR